MSNKYLKIILTIILLFNLLFLSSCGTIFKKNFVQTTDQIDYYILFLDSTGLVLFIIPGVAAITIDYITGTLFLNEEEAKLRADPRNPEKIRDLILYNYQNLDTNMVNKATQQISQHFKSNN